MVEYKGRVFFNHLDKKNIPKAFSGEIIFTKGDSSFESKDHFHEMKGEFFQNKNYIELKLTVYREEFSSAGYFVSDKMNSQFQGGWAENAEELEKGITFPAKLHFYNFKNLEDLLR